MDDLLRIKITILDVELVIFNVTFKKTKAEDQTFCQNYLILKVFSFSQKQKELISFHPHEISKI